MSVAMMAVFGVGFLLGLRHALEPDHMIAVSTIASRSGSLYKAAMAGIFWGIGHTMTLLIVGMLLIGIRVTIPPTVEQWMEAGVGMMLIVLGWMSVRAIRKEKVHVHAHEHDGERHIHFHSHRHQGDHEHHHDLNPQRASIWIGMIHGLAGSGALAMMTMASIETTVQAFIYILLFGLGTILGMLLFTVLLGLPFILFANYSEKTVQLLGMATGFLSIIYGAYYAYESLAIA
ncbi:MAG: hypothetical protein BAA01_15140 [Bacillus thermozeamaize]|uniref:Nickel/cobalt efflux system n=1 Tax=Bacillus thermozeamaize TaxID=230954 RepID=A0A1Y3PF10_9BACI|nr:MAG: hypothetical protein BAA01_15140 [Bacillus thermozeamaize]